MVRDGSNVRAGVRTRARINVTGLGLRLGIATRLWLYG